MRDEKGRAFSLKAVKQEYETQRLGGGMISDEQIISVSSSKVVGNVPIAGSLENALTINKADGTTVLFDGGEPEEITLTKVDTALNNASDNAVANRAVMAGLDGKADKNGTYATLTAGKLANALTFTGGVTATYNGVNAVTVPIPTVPTNVSEFTNDSGYLTAIPAEYVTETELTAKNYLTAIPSEYVTDAELTAKNYVTTTVLDGKGYLTAVPAEYVTDSELTAKGYQTAANVTSAITTALTPYIKTVDADTKYVKVADLEGAINAAVTAALANYYTKTEADARFEPKAVPAP